MTAEAEVMGKVGETGGSLGYSFAITKVEITNEFDIFGYHVEVTSIGSIGSVAAKYGFSYGKDSISVQGEYALGAGVGGKIKISKNEEKINGLNNDYYLEKYPSPNLPGL
jgi:hypothetical protein